MIDNILNEEHGPITYSVWKEKEVEPQESYQDEEAQVVDEGIKEERLNLRFVPNVIKEKGIYYFDVPKMGCFLSVPLNYQTCMYEAAFDEGVEDKVDVARRRAE